MVHGEHFHGHKGRLTTKKIHMITQQERFQQNFKMYIFENNKLLNRFKLQMSPVFIFKGRKKIPLIARFCLWIAGKYGGMVDLQFSDISAQPRHIPVKKRR